MQGGAKKRTRVQGTKGVGDMGVGQLIRSNGVRSSSRRGEDQTPRMAAVFLSKEDEICTTAVKESGGQGKEVVVV